ncbi:MAG: substrate-binding domain-containing protein [Cytophagaceae bacterium]|nr:substrate-binding domain-containing protein [Cytophagaceae bacterium]
MKNLLFIFSVLFVFSACNKDKENGTSGKIEVLSDEAFLPLITAEAKVFQSLNKKSNIAVRMLPETEAIKEFLEGNPEALISGRDLSSREKEYFKQKNIFPETFKIASDAIAFIVNSKRKDSVLSLKQLEDIFAGNTKSWKELGGAGEEIIIVVDKNNSGTFLFIADKLKVSNGQVKIYGAGSHEGIIEYIKKDSNAIGVIGLSWLSDDPATNKHLKNIRVLSVESEGRQYAPCQEDIATGKYPFIREIYYINKFKSGLGTGFASYVLNEDGQRIILKSGLLPAIMPGREVIFQ